MDRGQRIAGLVIVLAVAFLPFIMASIFSVVGADGSATSTRYQYFHGLLVELTSLALLAYVVRQNRQKLADFGLVFRFIDIVFGVLLWVAALCSYRLASPTILSACEFLGWHRAPPHTPTLGLGALSFSYVVISPVFEEMIVRAYLMSETIALTGSSALAILASVLLQTSYHLYQGLPYALSAGIIFLIFSVYYARTQRIVPVILAHLIWDISALLLYAAHAKVGHA